MRRVLRNLAVAVVCGLVALLGGCTGEDSAGPSIPTPSGDEMPPPAAWALTAEEALDAMGETASGMVSVTQWWCPQEYLGGWWPDSHLVDGAHYQYWNGDGDAMELDVCLLIGEPDEVGQLFTAMRSSPGGGNHRATVFDVGPIAEGSFGYEIAGAEGSGPSRAVVVNAGDALVSVSGHLVAWLVEPERAPTREQVADLARAAVEKLGRDDVEQMLSLWAHDVAGLLTEDEAAAVLGHGVRVTHRVIPDGVSRFPLFGVDVDATISATYSVEWGQAEKANVWVSVSRGPDVEAIYAAAAASMRARLDEHGTSEWQVNSLTPVGVDAVGKEDRLESGRVVYRDVFVNAGSVLIEISASVAADTSSSGDTWTGTDDALTREQFDDLVKAAVNNLADR